jgi:hypothetical protein
VCNRWPWTFSPAVGSHGKEDGEKNTIAWNGHPPSGSRNIDRLPPFDYCHIFSANLQPAIPGFVNVIDPLLAQIATDLPRDVKGEEYPWLPVDQKKMVWLRVGRLAQLSGKSPLASMRTRPL